MAIISDTVPCKQHWKTWLYETMYTTLNKVLLVKIYFTTPRQPPPLHHATVVIAAYSANTMSKEMEMIPHLLSK